MTSPLEVDPGIDPNDSLQPTGGYRRGQRDQVSVPQPYSLSDNRHVLALPYVFLILVMQSMYQLMKQIVGDPANMHTLAEISTVTKAATCGMVTTQKPESATKPDSSSGQDEKRSSTTDVGKLSRAWRSLVSSIVVTTRSAEKVATNPDSNSKELEDAVEQTVKARQEFRRCITTLEAQLLGQAKETEALLGLLQSQPRLGHKRKRQELENGNVKEATLHYS
ncbi:hypothetical protein MHU86_21443 [Fragilaria crotonensis]|nr:hypothetical protein MHU86_21443 [Fragilaria crotonensis]